MGDIANTKPTKPKTEGNSYSYGPFGNTTNRHEEIPNPFTFVGQFGVMEEPNGFYYMRARYYDPDTGRFVSEDPKGFGGGDVNLYVYVGNNPVNLIDPWGMDSSSKSRVFIRIWEFDVDAAQAIVDQANQNNILSRPGTFAGGAAAYTVGPALIAADKVMNSQLVDTITSIPPGTSTGHPGVDYGLTLLTIVSEVFKQYISKPFNEMLGPFDNTNQRER